MQSNPILTILKILAFAVLAFMVGVSSCQKENLENKVTKLDSSVSALTREIEEIGRKVEAGGGVRTQTGRPRDYPDRAELDARLDPSRPVGTPGRYADFLSDDPDPDVPPEAKGHEKGELSWWFGPEPKTFNFITSSDGSTTDLIEEYVGDSAAKRQWRNPSKFKPRVCWRVEVSPDFREYTLFFRKDVRWHKPVVEMAKYPHLDGKHMMSGRDYKFTLDIIMNKQTDCESKRGYFTDVKDVTLVDPHTVVVRWSKTVFHSIDAMMTTTLMPEFLYGVGEDGKPFPEATIGQSFNDHFYNRVGFCGCGPYAFMNYEAGQRTLLERFEDWYGFKSEAKFAIQRMRLLIFPDPGTSFLKIQAGDINVGGLSSPQWKQAVLDNKDPKSPFNDGRIEHWLGKSAQYAYFGWKNTHPLFTDRNVRKALTLACNRVEICRDVFLDRYRPMAAPIYPESADADPDLKPLPFDLAAAKKLLDEAGWVVNPGTGLRERKIGNETKSFEFTLLWPGPAPDFEAALNQYKNDLLSVGVKMNPQSMDWAAYQKKLKDREFEACSLLWVENGWEHDFDQIWHSRGIKEPGSSNHIEFSNPEVDRLSDELRETMDPAKRTEMVRRIGRVLYEEQPYCFFGWRNVFNVNWSYMKNVKEHPYRIRPFRRAVTMWDSR